MGSKKSGSTGAIIKGAFANVGRVIAALIMIGIITGCIVASVLTIYILRYINSDEQIRLEGYDMKFTTIIYATNPETGETFELQALQTSENRTAIEYQDIPRHVVDALVAVEDQRFWEHQGVDWKRTAGAFVNMFIPIYETSAGGSTITQQTIKNITGDDEVRIERKVQEIFRALNLEKNYSKEQILETYLNTVYFSNNAYGIQAAAETYFGKNASELTIAEGAAIIGITQFPGRYDPFVNPDKNKARQEWILQQMYEQENIKSIQTEKELQAAIDEELVFQADVAYAKARPVYSYFVDHVIEEVIADLMEKYDYTYQYAQQQLLFGGYRVYTTVDPEIQDFLEEFYSDVENFPQIRNETYPQSACVILDPNGRIIALTGEIGGKKGMREFSRATRAVRQNGSSMKPIGAYLQAFENDIVTWSTMLEDSPIQNPATGADWPVNHYGRYLGMITIDEAIQRSTNTIPVKLVQLMGPRRVYDFLVNNLGMNHLVERGVYEGVVRSDIDLFPMALGGLTEGVTPLEMAGAYQIFANGGYFTEPYSYTHVMDANGDTILEKDTLPRRVISAETATIINKLMQRVTTGPYGTGAAAKISGFPIAGKTGTTDEDKDQWFIGASPYYVCAVWLGYDTPERIRYYGYPPPIIFNSVMAPIHQGLEAKDFPVWGDVVQKQYCTESGDLFNPDYCTSGAYGWYKSSNLPKECTYHEDFEEGQDLDDDRRPSSGGTGTGIKFSTGSDDDDEVDMDEYLNRVQTR